MTPSPTAAHRGGRSCVRRPQAMRTHHAVVVAAPDEHRPARGGDRRAPPGPHRHQDRWAGKGDGRHSVPAAGRALPPGDTAIIAERGYDKEPSPTCSRPSSTARLQGSHERLGHRAAAPERPRRLSTNGSRRACPGRSAGQAHNATTGGCGSAPSSWRWSSSYRRLLSPRPPRPRCCPVPGWCPR